MGERGGGQTGGEGGEDTARLRDPAPAAAWMRRKGRGLFVLERWKRRARRCPSQAPGVRSPPPVLPPALSLGRRGPCVPRAKVGVCSLLPSKGRPRESHGCWVRGRGSGFLGLWLSLRLSLSRTPPTPRLYPPPRCPPLARMSFHGELPGHRGIRTQRRRAEGLPSPQPGLSPPRPPSPLPLPWSTLRSAGPVP